MKYSPREWTVKYCSPMEASTENELYQYHPTLEDSTEIVIFIHKNVINKYCPYQDSTQDRWSNIALRLKEFPRAQPSGNPSGKGLYLTIYRLYCPNTCIGISGTFLWLYPKLYIYIFILFSLRNSELLRSFYYGLPQHMLQYSQKI